MPKDSETGSSKTSLNLLGGGITGAYFHYGVLAALDDHLSKKSVDFDIFVGTSAGSLVASTCAVGLKPQEVVEATMQDKPLFQIRRTDIYRFSFIDWSKELFKVLWTLFYVTYSKIENFAESPSYFWALKESLPAGLFSMRYYEAWIRRIFEDNKLPSFFSQLKQELYIPAYDLDSGKRVVFGRPGFRHISFSKAIASSSAIPIFFQPFEIEDRFYTDGGLGEMAHLDIAAQAGAKLLIVVNPMVPVQNDSQKVQIKTVFGQKGRIKDKGLAYVFDQSLRNEIQLRTRTAMNYMGYLFPEVDLLLIEPDTDDDTMFQYNPMDFESRKHIVEYAYQLTRRKLRENSELWRRTLEKHSITLVGV